MHPIIAYLGVSDLNASVVGVYQARPIVRSCREREREREGESDLFANQENEWQGNTNTAGI